ncbi:MAG: hypothetical protein KF824_04485 [Fimbriimonadaceae bacterium]|nr:MAG: hypothetical protein KF824_04485 [Fimbriimonadaceae bacterium]
MVKKIVLLIALVGLVGCASKPATQAAENQTSMEDQPVVIQNPDTGSQEQQNLNQ